MYSLLSNSLKLVHTAGHVELMLRVWLGTFLSVTWRYTHTFFCSRCFRPIFVLCLGKESLAKVCVCHLLLSVCPVPWHAQRAMLVDLSPHLLQQASPLLFWHLVSCTGCLSVSYVMLLKLFPWAGTWPSQKYMCALFIITMWHFCSFHITQFWNPMWSLGASPLRAVAFWSHYGMCDDVQHML